MHVLIGWPGGSPQDTAVLVGGIVVIYLALIWLTSILWVVRDIRARTTDIASQVTAVVIASALPFVGLPIYMILRPAETMQTAYDRQLEEEAILTELHAISACPNCRRAIDDEYMVCPHCATELRDSCRHCQRSIAKAWATCPYCATSREAAAPAVATRAQRLQVTEPPPIDLRPAEPVARESSTSTIDRDALAEQAGAERRRENTTSVIDRDALRDGDDDQPGDEAKSPAPLRASKATSGD